MSWNLPGCPWLITHTSMLETNQPKMFTIAGQDYVFWKNQNNEITAIENKCPHMGAKLSDGWICRETNTIVCPFHALNFDNTGRAIVQNEKKSLPLLKQLKLFIQEGFIWTYCNEEPKIPIPDAIINLFTNYHFVGMVGETTVKADFLTALEINYDYNHAKGVHRDLLRVKDLEAADFQFEEYSFAAKLKQIREKNTIDEYLKNPLLLVSPSTVNLELEHYFPSCVASHHNQPPLGKLCEVFVIYPETRTTTKMFVLIFKESSIGIMNQIVDGQIKSILEEVVRQDAVMAENLYHNAQIKIKLPNEEPLNFARQLYYQWTG